jgi:organic hydroperoxide reductase OsmC/OhrA
VSARTRTHAYDVALAWTGAAAGATRTYAGYSREHELAFAGKPSLRASADPAFRGDAGAHNPEELLVAALASCHMLSYLAHCALAGIPVIAYTDAARGEMDERAGSGAFVRVVLRPRVVVDDDRLERANALHRDAHASCFIANSVNFPVVCEPEIVRYAP